MPVIQLHYHPRKLGISTSVSVVLPLEATRAQNQPGSFEGWLDKHEEKLPVLWLLHGGGGCHQDFLFGSMVVQLANQYHMAVVMPDGQNGSWTDMTYGPSWETYLVEGLPEYVYNHFPISYKREDNFIAGVSMGGYGAIHTALRHPEKYAAACGMGAGVWLPIKYALGETIDEGLATLDANLASTFGTDRQAVLGSRYDCLQAAKDAVAAGKNLPRMLSCCGTLDFSYNENVQFRNDIRALGVSYEWMETEAAHDDMAWNEFIPRMFAWLKQEG